MIVDIEDNQTDLSIDAPSVERLVLFMLDYLKLTGDEISIRFVSDEEMRELHADHFDDPASTDCITFPIDLDETEEPAILGICVICPQTAIEYAKKYKTDPYRELSLYLIHTLLHLKGYDDIEEEDRIEMKEQEVICMSAAEKEGLLLRDVRWILTIYPTCDNM